MAQVTPQQFAELVLTELAEIHALAFGIHDYLIVDIANRTGRPGSEVARLLSEQCKQRAAEYADDLFRRVRLNEREDHDRKLG